MCTYLSSTNLLPTLGTGMIDQGLQNSFKVRGPVTTSFELAGPDSYYIKIYFTIIVTNSTCICYISKANLSVLSLWLFRFVRLLKLNLQPLTRTFLLFRLMAHAGFTSRGNLQIMIFRGSCYSFILSKHVVSQPLIKTLNFQFGF